MEPVVKEVERTAVVAETEDLIHLYRRGFLHGPLRGALGEGDGIPGFLAVLHHPQVVTFVARATGGALLGAALLAQKLEAVDWVDRSFLERQDPAAADLGKLYYLPYVIIDPAHQARGVLEFLFEKVAQRVVADDAVVGFDSCQAHARIVERFVNHLQRQSPTAEVQPIDTHTFYLARARRRADHEPLADLNRSPDPPSRQ